MPNINLQTPISISDIQTTSPLPNDRYRSTSSGLLTSWVAKEVGIKGINYGLVRQLADYLLADGRNLIGKPFSVGFCNTDTWDRVC